MKFILSLALALMVCTTSFAVQDELKIGNRDFTAKFLKEMPNKNVVFSPFGVQILLALVTSATRRFGPAITEIIRVGELPTTKDKIHAQFKKIVGSVKTIDHDFKYFDLSKIYLRQGSVVQNWFNTTAIETYNAAPEFVDFTNPITVADSINNWVADETNNNINNIISSHKITSTINALLVNAIYIKGKWDIPFEPAETKTKYFRTSEGSDGMKEVDMMHTYKKNYLYFEDTQAQYLKIGLVRKGGKSEMVFVLPRQDDGLKDLVENHLDTALFPHPFEPAEVNVGLPKFKITSNIEVKDILEKLGLTQIFTRGAPLEGYHYRGQVFNTFAEFFQKVFIKVDESGVTATSAAIIIPIVDFALETTYRDFYADHPFLFYIRVDGVIIYAGQVYSP